jgi:predicted RNA-binding protein YlxR (DUF448 family)
MTKTIKQKTQIKKIPLRRDLVSREMFDKREMLRIVLNKEGEISIDPSGKKNGRGTYVKMDNESTKILFDKKLLDKEFKTKVDESFYNEIIEYVSYQLARKELLNNQIIYKKENT